MYTAVYTRDGQERARLGTEPAPIEDSLLGDLTSLIEAARVRVATTVNSELVTLYWGIGKRIREDVLGGERAAYGRDVVKQVATQLSARYGRGYGWRNLFRMVKFAELYPDAEILSPVATQLTWTNIVELLTIDEQPKRDFYMAMCAHERWSKRMLSAKIKSKLFERLSLSLPIRHRWLGFVQVPVGPSR